MFKFVALLAFAAAASTHHVPFSYHFTAQHPIYVAKHEPKVEHWAEKPKADEHKSQWDHKEHSCDHKDEEKPANYDFKYEVHDEKTGDIKRQSETASNGVVKGQYSLIDADGFRRVVEYTADDNHGFQATVKREPTHHKIPQPEKKEEEPKNEHWW